MLQKPIFALCSNPDKIDLTNNVDEFLSVSDSVSISGTTLIILLIWAGWFWKIVALHQCWTTTKKTIWPLKREVLVENQRAVRQLSNLISGFMLYYRIHGFLRSQFSVQTATQSKVFHLRVAMETQHFVDIWKTVLSLFVQ